MRTKEKILWIGVSSVPTSRKIQREKTVFWTVLVLGSFSYLVTINILGYSCKSEDTFVKTEMYFYSMGGDCTQICDFFLKTHFCFLRGGEWQCTASAVLFYTED